MVRPLVTTLVVLLVAAAGLMAVAATRRAKQDRTAQQRPAAEAPFAGTQPLKPLPKVADAAAPVPRPAAPAKPKTFGVLRVRAGRTLQLRSKPRGRVLASVGATTQFGSPTTLAVAAERGGWLGVTSTDLPNGKIGWIKARKGAYERHRTRLAIRIDLSRRSLKLMSGKRVLRRATVGIGRSGSPTPSGRYAITDKLPGSRYGAFYGCCILALSGHQTNTPAGWRGGDRLAIHGTNDPGSIGQPSSAGCLHAEAADLRVLMRRVPLGTTVFISA
jgi:lipoprotein-anchoring transpeptidase ErfK/SrfK